MEQNRKWTKLGIFSFILSILTIIPTFFIFVHSINRGTMRFLPLGFLIIIFPLVLSIISLVKISKHNLKGEAFAIIALIISSILFLGLVLVILLFLTMLSIFGPNPTI